jgi:cystathionine beta-lyase family protein involved in aluminum resistance
MSVACHVRTAFRTHLGIHEQTSRDYSDKKDFVKGQIEDMEREVKMKSLAIIAVIDNGYGKRLNQG